MIFEKKSFLKKYVVVNLYMNKEILPNLFGSLKLTPNFHEEIGT